MVNSVLVHAGKFLHYHTVGKWEYVSRKKVTYREGNTKPDAVVIVPISLNGNQVILINEYRVPVGHRTLGFPAGLIDDGETIGDCVRRELKEETGLDVHDILLITPPTFSSEGLSDELTTVVYVSAVGNFNTSGNTDGEDIVIVPTTIYELKDLLNQPRFRWSAKAYFICSELSRHGTRWLR